MRTTNVPANWNLSDPSTWSLSATADAHMGYHETGMAVRAYKDFCYSATDYANGDLDHMDPDEARDAAEWWTLVLSNLLNGHVAEAEASPETVARAYAALGYANPDDLVWAGFDGIEDEADFYHELANAIAEQERQP